MSDKTNHAIIMMGPMPAIVTVWGYDGENSPLVLVVLVLLLLILLLILLLVLLALLLLLLVRHA